MKVILASSNKGKIKEIEQMIHMDVIPYKELLGDLEIVEDGKSFKENAIIKAKTIYDALGDENAVVISDDSGITVPILGGEPGIYSARYAGVGASDKENLNKLIQRLKEKGIKRTPAYYTAAIAIASKYGINTVHGWMWGEVIDEARGEKGFGYDPMFIPQGFDKTLGELDEEIKKSISHRAKALELAKIILKRWE
ncbi:MULTISPECIES: RdgB/HAM1 family non-canonical purine NTP pyrophosphatase [unclassified Nitratiruptor]|uniref:RdgB/HAM1 family non-canonical purine NTP pyrophosphatase n=1 Tax=unclassified Nitratiruptor TaxID=2624044 RepID=UPI001916AA7A|nr:MULTISPECIES: RdgB/HAM1 family non-canonical purine NTP pyrophosphatase [unclassified Nitratiruptor]BCD60929.1 XTP/dITP diphosphohydrolase [Nitratiruptor sp. YY08-10]BCD64861.1 XTP/dITP diphosphohydrolase [Nitratiruptor sp. YY08-14]